ncbi:ABC transporter substrate-binding protein [Spirochaeta isovalerica]|uniref:Putative ABC transport system substrate-binding protein n=1 Tax=Spirochaeta isovalerica TaxID=150 RepID=A0A841R7W6_9SPIO|nr:ABC transporter substrate-binding protein [Spirochaeta isovalerica]MBB6481374.1 putative ABC transport system substrate-binding protein [Spirochaeta isovalerica]
MKKITIFALVLSVLAMPVLAGGQSDEEKTVKIGISKIVEHPALNAIEQGIQDELAALGYADAEYDLQNAAGDMNTASQIAAMFKMEKVDVAVGIATPTAIALATGIKDQPVVFSAVTDPVGAGLVDNLEEGKNNVTGISDMTPVQMQIGIIADLGNVKSIGHIYSSGEPNAVKLAEYAEEGCRDRGIEFVAATVANSSEVMQAAASIANKVDAIYLSTDNTVFSALGSVVEVATKAGIPVFTADTTSAVDSGVLGAYGFDYYKLGRATGKLVARILEGEDPASIPTQFMTEASDLDLVLNLDVAEALGLSIPDALVKDATTVVKDGKVQ